MPLQVCSPPGDRSPPPFRPYRHDTSAELLRYARDLSHSIILRTGVLQELALRDCAEMVSICKVMLLTGDPDEWFTAIWALALLDIPDAYTTLDRIAGSCNRAYRTMMDDLIFRARNLRARHVRPGGDGSEGCRARPRDEPANCEHPHGQL